MKTSLTVKLFNKPYSLFLLMSLLLLISSFFFWGQTVDIQLHDTYYVIAKNYVAFALAFGFFVGWAVYKVIYRALLSKYLTWTHIVLTLTAFLLLIVASFLNQEISTPEYGKANPFEVLINDAQRERNVSLVIIISFIMGQLAFIGNVIGGLIKRQI